MDELVTGLTSNSTYYYRTYAINSYGVGYGSILSFNTKSASTCNGSVTINGTKTDIRQVDLGEDTGRVTLIYSTNGYPIRIRVMSVDETTTGYVGSSSYDVGGSNRLQFIQAFQDFFGPNDYTLYPIDTYPRITSPSGSVSFNKTWTGMVNVSVESPMNGTQWSYTLSCPQY